MREREMKVDIYTHYFKVTEFNEVAHNALLRFCLHLTTSETMINRFGVVEKTGEKTYAARTQSKTEYRFIITCLDTFIRYLDVVSGIPEKSLIKIDHRNDVPFGLPVKLVPDPNFIPRDYQGNLINHAARLPVPGREDSPEYKRILEIQMGKGKAQSLSSLIKTPGGWITMGEIKVGDKISSPDGGTTIVTGVFPQGLKDIYRITFEDGRSTEIELEHLWRVYNSDAKRWVTVNTKCIKEGLESFNSDLYIPLIKSERLDHGKRFNKFFERMEDSVGPCFTLKKQHEADDLQMLIRSLGGISELKKSGDNYKVTFDFTKVMLKIKSVEFSHIGPTQCISVDHPDHLYITDDYIVTHNTKMALYAIYLMSTRALVQLKPMYMQKWINDIKEMFDGFPGSQFKKTDIMAISGNKHLSNAIHLALEGKMEAKFIIISNRTLQIFIDEYEEGVDVVAKYGCVPDDLMKIFQIGTKLTDEAHEFLPRDYKVASTDPLVTVMREGRQPGISLILATQQPGKTSLLTARVWNKSENDLEKICKINPTQI
jgi:hypothetical protein